MYNLTMKSITNLKKQQYSRIFEKKNQTFAANCEGKSSHSICIKTCLITKLPLITKS